MTWRTSVAALVIAGVSTTALAGCGAAGHAATGTTIPSQTTHARTSAPPTTTGLGSGSVSNAAGLTSAPADIFNQIIMLNATTGLVWGYVQGGFAIWKTTDGGQHWHRDVVAAAPPRSPANQVIPVVDFRSSQVGWIAWITPGTPDNALTVLHTQDGGRHWTKYGQKVPPVVGQVAQITFPTNRDGWIRTWSQAAAFYQDPSILQTTTGGQTWTLVSSATGYIPNNRATPDALPDVTQPLPMTFISPHDGWVAAGSVFATATPQATLYHTVTGGARWLPAPLPMPSGYRHRGTRAYPPVFSGTDGSILIQFLGGTTAHAHAVVTERSADGGKTWSVGTPLAVPGQGNVVASFPTPNHGWVIGAQGAPFAETTNAGQSWQTILIARPLKTAIAHHYAIQQLDMVTSKIGWIMLQRPVGENGATITKFFKTTNGGQTWSAERVGS